MNLFYMWNKWLLEIWDVLSFCFTFLNLFCVELDVSFYISSATWPKQTANYTWMNLVLLKSPSCCVRSHSRLVWVTSVCSQMSGRAATDCFGTRWVALGSPLSHLWSFSEKGHLGAHQCSDKVIVSYRSRPQRDEGAGCTSAHTHILLRHSHLIKM